MVLKIRLSRFGKTNRPFYNIVLTHARTARDAKPLEVLGTYDPIPRPAAFGAGKPVKDVKIDVGRAKYWLGVGAKTSGTAGRLLGMMGLMEPRFHVQRMRELGAGVEKEVEGGGEGGEVR